MTRAGKIWLIIGGIALLGAVSGVFLVFTLRKTAPQAIEASDILPFLQDGDILLRMSDTPWSVMFRDFSLTDKRFSHLGIVRFREGTLTVINSVGSLKNREKGVDEVSLERFLSAATAIGVFRAQFTDGTLIADRALEYVGRPFDWGFDLNNDDKIYCTELLYAVLRSAAPAYKPVTYSVEQLGKEIFPLDSVSHSPDFAEITYTSIKPSGNKTRNQ